MYMEFVNVYGICYKCIWNSLMYMEFVNVYGICYKCKWNSL